MGEEGRSCMETDVVLSSRALNDTRESSGGSGGAGDVAGAAAEVDLSFLCFLLLVGVGACPEGRSTSCGAPLLPLLLLLLAVWSSAGDTLRSTRLWLRGDDTSFGRDLRGACSSMGALYALVMVGRKKSINV